MKKNEHALHLCHHSKVHVKTQDGLDACIKANQCFSDDPCPLMQAFPKAKVPVKKSLQSSKTSISAKAEVKKSTKHHSLILLLWALIR